MFREKDPTKPCSYENLLDNPICAAFIKPKRYRPQLEYRIVWWAEPGKAPKDEIVIDVPRVRDLLIPVEFHGITKELLATKESTVPIATKIHTISGSRTPRFLVRYPNEIACPAVIEGDAGLGRCLGFRIVAGSLSNVEIADGLVGVLDTAEGRFFTPHPIDDIASIEFFHGELDD